MMPGEPSRKSHKKSFCSGGLVVDGCLSLLSIGIPVCRVASVFLRGWDHSSGIFNRNIIEKIKKVKAETQIHGWDCDKGNQFDSLDSSLIFQECGYFRLGAS